MVLKKTFTIPNLLSILRLVLSFIMLILAVVGNAGLFVIVLVIAIILDAIDGPIARRIHQVSELGPKLDSWADFSVYIIFLIGAWLLWPEIIKRELVYIILVACSLILPAIAGLAKFHVPTSYHTWLVKIAAVTIVPAALVLFLNGPAWPFHAATIISVLAGTEEILITLVLDKPRSDVGGLIRILKQRSSGDQT